MDAILSARQILETIIPFVHLLVTNARISIKSARFPNKGAVQLLKESAVSIWHFSFFLHRTRTVSLGLA